MRKSLLSLIFLLIFISARSEVKLGFNGEEAASVGIYIKDLKTGQVIASNDPYRSILPASVMKAVTAATAITSLDYDFKFATQVYLTGPVSAGVCSGDLLIKSCADPTIDSENFKDMPSFKSEIAKALADKGVKTITGKIIINESLSDAGVISQWEVDDVAWSYGAGLYGFNFLDNTFSLWPATKRTVPEVEDLNLTVRQARAIDLVRGIDSDNLTVYGPKPNDKTWRVKASMNNPARIFVADLRKYLADKGIHVQQKAVKAAPGNQTLLFTHYSPELSKILYEMMVESHNLYAEGILRAINPGATRQQAIERQAKIWSDRGISTFGNKILDGSGLSRADRLQPILMANVLEWMAKSRYASDYVSFFPRCGQNGTVKNLLKGSALEGQLALKSGSMNAVQCFAGYKLDADAKPTHVVVIFINAFYCDRSVLRKSIENFLLDTFK